MLRSASLRALATNSALVLVSAGVALAVGEAVVRRVAPRHRPLSVALRGLYIPDSVLGYVTTPHFRRRVHGPGFTSEVHTNALGLRDDPVGPRTRDTLRILGLGDSFTFGVHAGERRRCFIEQLETTLSDDMASRPSPSGARAAQVVNGGVDGYGTVQEIGRLERIGSEVAPDGVLLAFYLGNDFTDNSGATRMTVVDGYQMLEASAAPFRAHFRPLHRRVRLWLHAHSELYLLAKERLLHPVRARMASDAPAAEPKAFDYYVYDAGYAHTLREVPTPQVEAGIAATQAALIRLRRWCDGHGASALIVALPTEQQVDPAARAAWIARFGLRADELDFERPGRVLAELALQAGIPCFDLAPAFRDRLAAGDTLFLSGDNHWNAQGHALAARAMRDAVRRELVDHTPAALVGRR